MSAETTITQEDRRAATSVTTSQSGHRFEIQLGHLCNNRCVFCSSGQLTAMKIARPVPIEPILEALDQARAAGATHLTFLGGEPTIHKRFLEALSHAVKLGFEHIVIFTNGVMFPHPGFIDSITALGRFEWRISIQGATDEAHVATTGRADSFQRILHGLGELQRRGQLVTANMCVNERSYRSLPHYPELLREYGVRQLHIDIVRPESTGERNEDYLREIMPRYSEMAPYYSEMLEGFERWDPDFDINVGNLPYCVIPQWGSRIHHGGQETVTKSSDGEGLQDAMNKYEWQTSLRTHLPTCEECVFRSRCTGIFRVYLELHGGEEFRPVSREQLAALDPQRRNLVLLLGDRVAALRTSLPSAPSPWRFVQEVSEDRHRRVEMRFAHVAGGAARLRFVAPHRGVAPVIETSDYALEGEVEATVPPADASGLLLWVHGLLAESAGEEGLPDLPSDLLERLYGRAVLPRLRQRVGLLGRRVQERLTRRGWWADDLRWASDEAAVVTLHGPAEARIDLGFSLAMRGAKPHLGVDFHPVPGGEETERRAVVEEVVALLREPARAGVAAPVAEAAVNA